MEVHERIKRRRTELGIPEQEAAREVGITVDSYCDIEMHADEIRTVTHLGEVKRLCNLLGLAVPELFDLRCPFCDEGIGYSEDFLLPRNELVRRRRESMGLSVYELADLLGFHEVAVQEMERNEDFLESWSIDLIHNLSKEISVPLQVLLKIRCKRCGR
jgi:DNA-binding XRE family transcriptional regulator